MTWRLMASATSRETVRLPSAAMRRTCSASSARIRAHTATFIVYKRYRQVRKAEVLSSANRTLAGVTVVVSGYDLVQSHDCATVACDQEATVQLGSLWYCRHHVGPIPKNAARGSSTNGSTAANRWELARRLRERGSTRPEIAAELGVSLSTVGNYLNGSGKPTGARLSASGTSVKGSGHRETPANGEAVRGSFEFRAAALVELGRKVDETRAEFELAQTRYEEACRRWAEAVAKLAQTSQPSEPRAPAYRPGPGPRS
jgi:transcriptional regulator with XRE-family HTH domain